MREESSTFGIVDADSEQVFELSELAERQRLVLESRRYHEMQRVRRREIERRRRRAQIRRHRVIALSLLGTVVFGIWFGVAATTGASPTRHDVPVVTVTSELARFRVVPGHLAPLSWPAKGQGAVAVLGTGLVSSSPGEVAVPIASLTKMMTAYIILQDFPLAPGANGPSLKMTARDVQFWVQASQTDESNAPVALGEVLSERQLLEALLLPSADNIANTLAIWDAGSIASFVAKMNVTARRLGLTDTHYADASGVDPASRSTAANQALLASDLMTNPTLRSIVRLSNVVFPVAGHIYNVNPALGVDGIIGVKSGYTSHALGCLTTAAFHTVGTSSAFVIAVSLGQPNGLYAAAHVDEGLIAQAGKQLVPYQPVGDSTEIGTVGTAGTPAVQVALRSVPPTLVGWPGLRISEKLVPATLPSARHAGSIVFATKYGEIGQARLVYDATSSVTTTS